MRRMVFMGERDEFLQGQRHLFFRCFIIRHLFACIDKENDQAFAVLFQGR